ncbi:MAG: hypothetical protein GXY19_13350 [Phycisphaerae bacterium]|nr:hypothetical protein [Phycisphaerae bacterium]
MKRRHCLVCVTFLILILIWAGCGKKDAGEEKSAGPAPVSAEQITAVRNALAQGMQQVAFTSVKPSDVGKTCLIEARTPEGGVRIPPPPPPLGMVQTAGQVTFYRGELDSISSESLTVRKAYPTSGSFKKLEIPQADIQSIHLAR